MCLRQLWLNRRHLLSALYFCKLFCKIFAVIVKKTSVINRVSEKQRQKKNYVSKAELNEKNTNFVLVNSMR